MGTTCGRLPKLDSSLQLSDEQATLIKNNYSKLANDHSHEVALICYERILQEVKDTPSILRKVGTDPNSDSGIMGQGLTFLKGFEKFIYLANKQDALFEGAKELSQSHIAKYGLTAKHMARAMSAIEEVFINEAMLHCSSEHEATYSAWRQFFQQIVNVFTVISTQES